MADHLTLDVIDRPAGGVLRTLQRATALRRDGTPGLRSLIKLGTARFVPRPVFAVTPRRIALLTVWEDGDAVEQSWGSSIARLAAGAGEHWHVHGELARASFSEPWRGWDPDVAAARRLGDDEPALILISGNLRARHAPVFVRDTARAVNHAFAQPGYLGGLGINSSLLNTTSCSAWRTYADARAFAYKPGAHATVMKRDRDGEHHSTEWFLRVRPLVERGTLRGRAPFGDLLQPAVAA